MSPPSYYQQRQPLLRARMEHEDEASEHSFHQHFPLEFSGKDVLDIGCGYGGRTVWFEEAGAKSVTGIEVDPALVAETLAFAADRGVEVSARLAFAENLPFADDSFDVLTSYDVFEHVQSLPKALAECYRVLRPGGSLYALFPPSTTPRVALTCMVTCPGSRRRICSSRAPR